MSITFPTFIDKEIVTPEKLNDFVQALEAKFAAGLSSAEIEWDLIAGGNIEMGAFEIRGGTKIWDVVNAKSFEDDWDAALLAGGLAGCLFIPPNTTITMDGSAMAGSSLTIKGSGPTSVLQLESGASGNHLLRNDDNGFSLYMENLTLDGADVATTAGIILRGAEEVSFNGVTFKDFSLAALQLVKSSDPCRSLRITNCRFEGGAGYHIEASSVRELIIADNVFDTCAVTAVQIVANSATAIIQRVTVDNNVFKSCEGDVINILGGSGAFHANQAHIGVHGNVADDNNSIVVGTDAKRLQYVNVSDNVIPDSAGDALTLGAQFGTISDNVMPGATGDGLDLTSSMLLKVAGNLFVDAGAYGIDAVDSEKCSITDNDCQGAITAPILRSDSITDPSLTYGNSDNPETGPLTTWITTGGSLTFPARTFRVGDVLDIIASANDTQSSTKTSALTLNGRTIGSVQSHGATDTLGIASRVYILTATTLQFVAHGGHSGAAKTDHFSGGSNTGIDIESEMILTMSLCTPYGFAVTITRGVVQ